MINFTIARETLLKPLQQVCNPLGGRPAFPILGNVLLQVSEGEISLTSTDLEIEMVVSIPMELTNQSGSITVPARKFLDICRALPDGAELSIQLEEERLLIRSGRSRFSLTTLPVTEYPALPDWPVIVELSLPQNRLKRLIDATQFSMAHQDVRYYLNGMMFETDGNVLRTIATDGHRLAICTTPIIDSLEKHSVIVPRKGILELSRLLETKEETVTLQIGSNNIRVHLGETVFTTKLIDGQFPDYRRVLPNNPTKVLEASCDMLKQAFSRAAILSNEKFRGVRLFLQKNQLKIIATNPEQEEAEEILDVHYLGNPLEIGFNVTYLLDILNALKCERIKILMLDSVSSAQLEDSSNHSALYVVMPMRL